jgi:signal transduction histidine kinase
VDVRVRTWSSHPVLAAGVSFIAGSALFAVMAAAIPIRGVVILTIIWCLLWAAVVGVSAWKLGPLFGVPFALAAAVSIDSFYIAPYRPFDSHDWVNYLVTAMYIAIGVFVGAILQATQRRVATTETARDALADEQAALRRIAILIAKGAAPEEVFTAVAREMRTYIAADITRIIRINPDGTATLVGGTSVGDRTGPLGPIEPGLATAEVQRTGKTARVDDFSGVDPELVSRWFGTTGRAPHAVACPVVVGGRLWGTIVAGLLSGPLPADTERRMGQFSELLTIAIANALSRTELAASRARIVVAADQARRQLERNLHDGIQQRLVSLALQLRVLERRVNSEEQQLKSSLAAAVEELNQTTDEVREIAQGIHPAILTQGGLAPALRTLALRCSIPVEVVVEPEHRLPEPIEVAAYYVTAEALTNAAKHAAGSRAWVTVERQGGLLSLRIGDDGIGGADPVTGGGLTGIRDRVEALGGSFLVHSPPDEGTVLEVALPVVL